MNNKVLDDKEGDLVLLTHDLEWELVKKLFLFNGVLDSVSQDFNFASLCRYLYELCQLFSRWYKACQIKNAERSVKKSRLFLANTIAKTIRDGLYALGIETPTKI